MYHRILISILLLALTGFCAQAQTPLQYNNKLVNITDSLNAKGSRWVRTFKTAKVIKEFGTLKPYRSDLQEYINRKMAELKADGDVDGSGELKKAVLEFLDYEKNMVDNHFMPMEQFNETTTDEDIKAAVLSLSQESQKEEAILMKVDAAQDAYARKNNIKMEEPSTK